MSSKISTLYDDFVARITAVLPSHIRMSDAYLLVKNTDSEKRQGFGVKIGSGSHTGNNLSCDIILEQSLTLILSRIVTAQEIDGSGKAGTEKQLLEDLFLVIQDVEKECTLQDPTIVIYGAYVSHSGIQFIEGTQDNWMRIEANFSFRYKQDLN